MDSILPQHGPSGCLRVLRSRGDSGEDTSYKNGFLSFRGLRVFEVISAEVSMLHR